MKKQEVYYSYCPIPNATYLALRSNMLQTGMAEAGYSLRCLQELSMDQWAAHFTYKSDRLFRNGGYSPPIWARSQGEKVELLGVNMIWEKLPVLVRADSDIVEFDQLKGKRLAVSVHPNVIFDVHQFVTRQGWREALERHEIGADEVRWVELKNYDGIAREGRGAKGGQIDRSEAEALEQGTVDAIYGKFPRSERMLAGGSFRRLEDIWTAYPVLLTVSSALAEREPEAVTAYLKQTVKAARWAVRHGDEAAVLLAEQTNGTPEEFRRSFSEKTLLNLEPNLTDGSLAAVERCVQFLYDNRCIPAPVEVGRWANPHFLEQARIQAEAELGEIDHVQSVVSGAD